MKIRASILDISWFKLLTSFNNISELKFLTYHFNTQNTETWKVL